MAASQDAKNWLAFDRSTVNTQSCLTLVFQPKTISKSNSGTSSIEVSDISSPLPSTRQYPALVTINEGREGHLDSSNPLPFRTVSTDLDRKLAQQAIRINAIVYIAPPHCTALEIQLDKNIARVEVASQLKAKQEASTTKLIKCRIKFGYQC